MTSGVFRQLPHMIPSFPSFLILILGLATNIDFMHGSHCCIDRLMYNTGAQHTNQDDHS